MIGQKHKKRFERWQLRLSPTTLFLSQIVVLELVPLIEEQGFIWVDLEMQMPDFPVAGSDIRLERLNGDIIDDVTIYFAKYDLPRFQIVLTRRKAEEPYEIIRSANLVKRSNEYYHYWGKPWWCPNKIWSERASVREVRVVGEKINQIINFLSNGDRGSNISPQVNAVLLR